MSRAMVNYRERDLSAYAPIGVTYGAAIILPAKKGKRNWVHHVTSKKQLLSLFTPNGQIEVGDSPAFFSAMTILEATSNLLVVVPDARGNLRSGAKLFHNANPEVIRSGVADPQAFNDFGNASMIVTASSEGVWGDQLYITNHYYKEDEKVSKDPSKSSSPADFTVDLAQAWGDGFPVKVYSKHLPRELDNNTVYFLKATGNTSDGKKEYKLYETQKDALSSGKQAVQVTQYFNPSSESDKVEFYISPAIQFTKIPGTSCLRVFHKSNLNDPIASYVFSKNLKARDLDGNNLYVEEVVKNSPYIEIADNPENGKLELFDVVTPTALGGGNDGEAITTGDMIKALRYFENTNEHQIKFFGDGGYTVPAFQQRIEQLCKKRGDCVAVLSAPLSAQSNPDTSAQEVVNYRKYDLNLNSSWAGLYSPHLKIYDEFNDRTVWASPDGFAIKAMIETASNYEIWYPVAGNQRGIVSALDTKVHYTDGDQDLLYDNGINPIIFDAGEGIKIWGQKTLLGQPSKLDRLHVRLLLITIGPALTKMLKSKLFEFNDSPTRASVVAIITAYMDRVQAKRGVTRYQVVCDETNNLPIDLANNRMNVDLIVCPNASVEYINFTMAVINETVTFDLAQQQI